MLRCNHCRNLICGVRNFHLLKDVWRFGSGVHEKKVKLCHPEKSPPPAAAAQRDQDMAVAAHRPGWQATDLLARLNFSEQAPNHKSGYRTQYRSDFRSCGISSKLQVLCFARSCWVRLQRDTPITFPSSIRLRGRFGTVISRDAAILHPSNHERSIAFTRRLRRTILNSSRPILDLGDPITKPPVTGR